MTFQTALFYVFAAILVFAALRVVTTRNPVQAALWLVLSFFTAAGVWLLLQAEFLAIALVLVYVGAVMVLFLFVVMMLDVNVDELRAGFWKHFPMAATIGALIALEMAAVLMGGFRPTEEPRAVPAVAAAAQAGVQYSNTKELGRLLYTEYLFPLEIAAVLLLVAIVAANGAARLSEAPEASASTGLSNAEALGRLLYTQYVYFFQAAGMVLLVAMIGAIVLTLRHKPGVKRQVIMDQVLRTPKTGMRMVSPKPGEGVDA